MNILKSCKAKTLLYLFYSVGIINSNRPPRVRPKSNKVAVKDSSKNEAEVVMIDLNKPRRKKIVLDGVSEDAKVYVVESKAQEEPQELSGPQKKIKIPTGVKVALVVAVGTVLITTLACVAWNWEVYAEECPKACAKGCANGLSDQASRNCINCCYQLPLLCCVAAVSNGNQGNRQRTNITRVH